MKAVIFLIITLASITSCNDESDLLIQNVKLFDGDKIIEHANVYVKGAIIQEISTESPKKSAKREIEGTGKTLIPGLINAHVHLNQVNQLKETAKYGILTVLDLFNTANSAAILREFRDSLGYSYYYSSGPVATVKGGHGTQFGMKIPTIKSPAEVEDFIARRIAEKSDFLKIIIEKGTKNYSVPTLSDSTVKKLLSEAIKKRLKTVVHISSKDDAIKVFENGADGIAHIWSKEATPIKNHELKKLSSKPFFVIPTLLVIKEASDRYPELVKMNFDSIKQEVKKLYNSGISLLSGTDCPNLGINCSDDLFNEMLLLAECGLKPVDVLKSATSNPASCFNLKDVGFIKKGSIANFVLIDGDPLSSISDIKEIEKVWKLGKEIIQD